MTYQGTFKTLTGDYEVINNQPIKFYKYNVLIGDPNDPNYATKTITDPIEVSEDQYTDLDDELVMFGTNPVVINADRQDLQKRIIISQATISLVSNTNLTEDLFAAHLGSIPVTISKLSNTQNGPTTVVFYGYVDPMQFDQGFAHNWEEVEVTATDPLGMLETITVGDLNYDNGTIASKKPYMHPYDLLVLMMQKIYSGFNINNATIKVNGYNGSNTPTAGTVWHAFKNTWINTSIFVGDTPDDWMSLDEVLENILKYFNMYIAMRGQNIILVSTVNQELESILFPQNTSLGTFATDESTSISVDDAYEQVNLTCEIEPVPDTPVEWSNDDFTSPYPHQELYMTEIVSPGEGERAFNAFRQMIQLQSMRQQISDYDYYLADPNLSSANRQAYMQRKAAVEAAKTSLEGDVSYENSYTVENYCYLLENKAFDFGDYGYTKQPFFTDTLHHDQREALRWLSEGKFRTAFIGFGRGNKVQKSVTDNSPTPSLKLDNWLVMSTLGDFDDSQSTLTGNSSTSLPYQISHLAQPIKYKKIERMNLSPTDNSVTNYLILTGNMLLNPIQQKTKRGLSWHAINETTRNNFRASGTWEGQDINDVSYEIRSLYIPFLSPTAQEMWHHTVPNPDNGDGAYYTQAWEYPSVRWSINPERESRRLMGVYGFLDNNENQTMKYEYSKPDDATDRISKIPILACQLRVSNNADPAADANDPNAKYCVERLDKGGGIFEWMTLTECNSHGLQPYFTIGIDPKIGDNIIGQKFSLQNNIDYTMGLDTSGTAIPIHFEDYLSGNVYFSILGPYNVVFDKVTHTTHHKFIFWNCSHWNTETMSILNHTNSIMLKDLKITFKSDNGKQSEYATTADNDLVYYSGTSPKYSEKLEEDVNICTGLEFEEALQRGIKPDLSNSYLLIDKTVDGVVKRVYYKGFGSEGSEVKPEVCFVDYQWREYVNGNPAKKLETQVQTKLFNNGPLGNMMSYEMLYMYMPNIYPDINSTLMAYETDLKMQHMTITMRETKTTRNIQI